MTDLGSAFQWCVILEKIRISVWLAILFFILHCKIHFSIGIRFAIVLFIIVCSVLIPEKFLWALSFLSTILSFLWVCIQDMVIVSILIRVHEHLICCAKVFSEAKGRKKINPWYMAYILACLSMGTISIALLYTTTNALKGATNAFLRYTVIIATSITGALFISISALSVISKGLLIPIGVITYASYLDFCIGHEFLAFRNSKSTRKTNFSDTAPPVLTVISLFHVVRSPSFQRLICRVILISSLRFFLFVLLFHIGCGIRKILLFDFSVESL